MKKTKQIYFGQLHDPNFSFTLEENLQSIGLPELKLTLEEKYLKPKMLVKALEDIILEIRSLD